LLGGRQLWPAVWVGSFAANVTIDAAVLPALVIATGSTLQSIAAAALARRYVGVPRRFESVDQVVRFLLLAALGSVIAPTFALLPLALSYEMPAAELAGNWMTWWQGDAAGMLVFAPLI